MNVPSEQEGDVVIEPETYQTRSTTCQASMVDEVRRTEHIYNAEVSDGENGDVSGMSVSLNVGCNLLQPSGGLRKMVHHPRYPLLEMFYDKSHRGKLLEERTEVLKPLRIRTRHPLQWDDRYTPYLRRAGFLPLARLVKDGLPKMDNAALTALVDRWRPETHTFHLPSGEMTITLQDVAMLFGLRIDGRAVTGSCEPAGWRDRVELLFGVRPTDPPEDAKDKKPTGVSSSWLAEHFGVPPLADAHKGVVARYARAWLWHLVAGFLFPDSSGNTMSWMWLPIICQDWENIATFSWGSATLGWLYRQMCDACRRTGENANLGGCAYLLQLWMWEHLPIGRPDRYAHGALPYDNGESVATVGFLWNNILTVHGNPGRRYTDYSNALDCLSAGHVTWEPYNRLEVQEMQLSPLCMMDNEYWCSVCPLICFYIVEYHLPNRVMHQFGMLQHCPPEHNDTRHELHGIDRRKQRGVKNWEQKHLGHVNAWNARAGNRVYGGPVHRDAQFNIYLDWLKENTRLKLHVAIDGHHIEDLPSDSEDVYNEYDYLTRKGRQPERGPLEDYIGQQLGRFANEASQALSVPVGSLEEASVLRGFLQRFQRGCRKMAFKLNCMAPRPPDAGAPSGSHTRSASTTRTSSMTLGRHGRGGALTIGSPRRMGKGAPPQDIMSVESEESSNSEASDPTFGQDEEISPSQLLDAPTPTQGGPPPKERAQAQVSSNVLFTNLGCPRHKKPCTRIPSHEGE
ncbi:unnamed protein product [Urochloa decumbens]|uniref:Aminotransferase-like plant mobile domain-containing protein n=1 Tax=Urochloa decumbens TaxID=240449 RepID=A0ABC9A2P1_9POAL